MAVARVIAKRVPRPKGGSDFARLGRYVIDARGRIDPTTWETWARVSDYVLDVAGSGVKVGAVRVTNCHTDDDPAAAALEVRAVQARNTRSKGDKTYHLVVAFPPGERPTAEQFRDVEDTLCAAIGLADHQRLSAVHTDRDHLHLHIAINTVHPRTFRNITPYYDHRRLMDACERLEIKHGLARTNHGADAAWALGLDRGHADGQGSHTPEPAQSAAASTPGRAGEMEAHGRRESFRSWVLTHAAVDLRAAVRDARDWPALHRGLARFDLEIRPRGAGLVIVPRVPPAEAGDRRSSVVAIKASDVDRGLSAQALTRRFGPYEPPTAEVRTLTPEQRYVAGPLAAELPEAGPADPARSGARPDATKTGAGTGDAEPRPGADRATPNDTPNEGSRGAPDTAALYADYQRAREAAAAARVAALTAERQEREAGAQRLAAAHAARRAAIRAATHLDRAARRAALRDLAAERAVDWEAQRRRGAGDRAAARVAHPLPTWGAYLEAAAAGGDATALAALRQQRRRAHETASRFSADLLAATDPERVRHVVFADRRPQPQRNGDVRYVVSDGGRVTDCAPHVRVDQRTAGAVALALALASERFVGQALAVGGTDEFRRAVAEEAGRVGFAVRFADPALDAMRVVAERQANRRRAEDGTSSPALRAFVEARNAACERVPTLEMHRVWTSADAGPAEYRGQRTLTDGSVVILLRRSSSSVRIEDVAATISPVSGTTDTVSGEASIANRTTQGYAPGANVGAPQSDDQGAPEEAAAEVLVVPVTQEAAAVARAWRVGASVEVNRDGAIQVPHGPTVHRAVSADGSAADRAAAQPSQPAATRSPKRGDGRTR